MPRSLQPGQRTELWIVEVGGGPPELVYSTNTVLLEAPNWAPTAAGFSERGRVLWRLGLGPRSS